MSLFRATATRFIPRTPRVAPVSLQTQQKRFATQDYGSGTGNPAGENPQAQGKNPSESKEHPGPSPPSASQKSSSSSSKKEQQQPSGGQGTKSSQGTQPQPKILNESPPRDEDAPPDVRQHNKEMEQRADRASAKVSGREQVENDKVSKDFWKGTGGADRQP